MSRWPVYSRENTPRGVPGKACEPPGGFVLFRESGTYCRHGIFTPRTMVSECVADIALIRLNADFIYPARFSMGARGENRMEPRASALGVRALDSAEVTYASHDGAMQLPRPLMDRDDTFWETVLEMKTRSAGIMRATRRTVLAHLPTHSIRHYAQLATLARKQGARLAHRLHRDASGPVNAYRNAGC